MVERGMTAPPSPAVPAARPGAAAPVGAPRPPSRIPSSRTAHRPATASPARRESLWQRAGHAILEVVHGTHVRLWLGVVLAVIAIGTLGYAAVFGWSLGDAVYMTVITLTTVGFREVRELTDWGPRAWTMLIAVSGVGIIFGTIGIVAEAVVSQASSGRREAKRMTDVVAALRGHYLVCGYGRVGSTVARELTHSGHRIVVIDIEPASLARAAADGHLVIEGDATDDDTLRQAGVDHARGLVTTIDSDANNVYVTLSARAMNPGLFIVGRANAEGSDAKLLQAGADRVVSPYTMAGRRIAELAVRPRVADFIDAALSHGDVRFSLEEVEIADGGLAGQRIGALRDEGAFTLAIVGPGGEIEANPAADRVLVPGESLVLSGPSDILERIRDRA